MTDQTYLDTAHLLRRAGFGSTTAEIQAAASRGLAAVTDDLLHPERTPDTFNDDQMMEALLALLPEARKENRNGREYVPLQTVKIWWTIRMLSTPHPLVEKMTLFWHGHFTSKDGNQQGELMMRQNQMFRKNALGSFRDITLAVARDPEMLRYLNGNQNFKAHANENFGRELMEIYTCGIGNYTENDVKASSRAFTGWNLRRDQFYFNPYQHDNDPKTFMGQTGNWNGNDIVDKLVAHPATARRLCTQLWSHFGYENPEPAVLDALVTTYYESGYSIRALLSQIFRSHAFYSDRARNAVIKCPVQYVLGTVKMMGLTQALPLTLDQISPAGDQAAAEITTDTPTQGQRALGRRLGLLAQLPNAMKSMGQDILEPPSVKGWDGGPRWINTATLLARIDFANSISQSRVAFDGQFTRAVNFVQQMNGTPETWVDYLAQTLGPLELTPQTRTTLVNYIQGSGEFEPQNVPAQVPVPENIAAMEPVKGGRGGRRAARVALGPRNARAAAYAGEEGRLRGVIPLIMATPEYQVC
jgi:uncharacterized protein (DUF1800 family)